MEEKVRHEIEVAARILKEAGATEVYVFGSAATGDMRPDSDIDLAIRGLPPRLFFPTMSKVTFAVSRPIDLVDLDDAKDFADFLTQEGELVRVG
jgi:predicted nucleotidyltransferase